MFIVTEIVAGRLAVVVVTFCENVEVIVSTIPLDVSVGGTTPVAVVVSGLVTVTVVNLYPHCPELFCPFLLQ